MILDYWKKSVSESISAFLENKEMLLVRRKF